MFYCTTVGIKCRRLLKAVFTQRTHHPSICSFTQSLSASLCSLSFTVTTGSAFTEPLQYSASHLCFSGLRGQRPSTAELSWIPRHRESSVVTWTWRLVRLKSSRNDHQWFNITAHCTCLSPVWWTHYFFMDISQGRRTPLHLNSSLSLLHKHQQPCSNVATACL